ncbi:uncharacterized protein LOC5502029 [Nematostella vectensis]|uniref:uncharacterized protein LOC5502029 n=1 Tax=Nematostella vectensis TaxID=45351 RepID=UPI0020772113|nr:uncharacterized protein LOC5502029 [Nematostella vectensis]
MWKQVSPDLENKHALCFQPFLVFHTQWLSHLSIVCPRYTENVQRVATMRLSKCVVLMMFCAAFSVTKTTSQQLCPRAMDLIIAIDSSYDLTPRDFAYEKRFVQIFTRQFPISSQNTRVGSVFSTSRQPRNVQLGRRISWISFARGIRYQRFTKSEKRIDVALRRAYRQFQYRKRRGEKVAQVLVVLTKGDQEPTDDGMPRLDRMVLPLRKIGVEVYVIAVRKSMRRPVSTKQMRLLVESKENIFVAKSFYHLSRNLKRIKKIASHICEAGDVEGMSPVAIYPLNNKIYGEDISGNDAPTAYIPRRVRPIRGPFGTPGGAFRLGGGYGHYIEISNSYGGKLDAKGSLTVLIWVFLENRPGPIVNFRRNGYGIGLYWERNKIMSARFFSRSGRIARRLRMVGLRPGKWYYLGLTYDVETGMAGLWVDGGKRFRRRVLRRIGRFRLGTHHPIRLGAIGRVKERFSGRVSCLQVWPEALDSSGILSLKERCRAQTDGRPPPSTDPCQSKPCKNGGACLAALNTPLRYRCRCRAGYAGRNCEIFEERPTARPTGRPTKRPSTRPQGRPTKKPSGTEGTPFLYLDIFRVRIVEYINVFRRLHGVGPVILSDVMNEEAQKWALHISKLGGAARDPKTSYGSNMCIQSGRRASLAKDCVFDWYDGVVNYDWHTHELSTKFMQFVQLVWRDSLYVGVGGVKGTQSRFYVVVYFDPPGNVKTTMKENVLGYTDVFLAMPQVPCPRGYVEIRGSCYKFHMTKDTWINAFHECTRENSTLLSVHSEEEVYYIDRVSISGRDGPLWTGLNDRIKKGMYSYTDGSSVEYLDWIPGEPSQKGEQCIGMRLKDSLNPYGSMADLNCKQKHQFVCRKPLEGLVTYRVTIELITLIWAEDLRLPGTLAHLELKAQIEKIIVEIFKGDVYLVTVMVEQFREIKPLDNESSKPKEEKSSPKVGVDIIVKFGPGVKPDPTIPIQETIKKNSGKLPKPLNKKTKIRKIEVLMPGEGPANVGHCHDACTAHCISHCNPLCCSSRVASKVVDPRIASTLLQQQIALIKQMQGGAVDPMVIEQAKQAQLALLRMPTYEPPQPAALPGPKCVNSMGYPCSFPSPECIPRNGVPCPQPIGQGMQASDAFMQRTQMQGQIPVMSGQYGMGAVTCVPGMRVPCTAGLLQQEQQRQPKSIKISVPKPERDFYVPRWAPPRPKLSQISGSCLPGAMCPPNYPGYGPQMGPMAAQGYAGQMMSQQLGMGLEPMPQQMPFPFGLLANQMGPITRPSSGMPGQMGGMQFQQPMGMELPFFPQNKAPCVPGPYRPCPPKSRSVVIPKQSGIQSPYTAFNGPLYPQYYPSSNVRQQSYNNNMRGNMLRDHPFFSPLFSQQQLLPQNTNRFSPYAPNTFPQMPYQPMPNPWMSRPQMLPFSFPRKQRKFRGSRKGATKVLSLQGNGIPALDITFGKPGSHLRQSSIGIPFGNPFMAPYSMGQGAMVGQYPPSQQIPFSMQSLQSTQRCVPRNGIPCPPEARQNGNPIFPMQGSFRPAMMGPMQRLFPPQMMGPMQRLFPPQIMGSMQRPFLPQMMGPMQRPFPPQMMGPMQRPFPPQMMGPMQQPMKFSKPLGPFPGSAIFQYPGFSPIRMSQNRKKSSAKKHGRSKGEKTKALHKKGENIFMQRPFPPPMMGPMQRPFPPPMMGPMQGPFNPPMMGPMQGPFPPPMMGPMQGPSPPPMMGPMQGPFPPPMMGPMQRPFPAPMMGPMQRPFPPPMMGPMQRPFPAPMMGPMQGPFNPPMMGPMQGPFPPPMMGPMQRPFPPPMMGPMQRPFLPPMMGPMQRPFPPPMMGPMQRLFPPPMMGPMQGPFPPPMMGPMQRIFPPQMMGPMQGPFSPLMQYQNPLSKQQNKKGKQGKKTKGIVMKGITFPTITRYIFPPHFMPPITQKPCVPKKGKPCPKPELPMYPPPMMGPMQIPFPPPMMQQRPFMPFQQPLPFGPFPGSAAFQYPSFKPIDKTAARKPSPLVVKLPNITLRYPVNKNYNKVKRRRPLHHNPMFNSMVQAATYPQHSPMMPSFPLQSPRLPMHTPFGMAPVMPFTNCALPCRQAYGSFCPSYCPKRCCRNRG